MQVGRIAGLALLISASCRGWNELRARQEPNAALEACEKGDQAACGAHSSVLYSRGRYTRAWPVALNACDAGVATGCAVVGAFLDNGVAPARSDRVAAAQYLRLGCEGEIGWACVDYGLRLLDAKAYAKAAEVERRACDAGALMGCSNYGHIIDNLWEGHIDHLDARRIFLSTCDAGLEAGCRRAGDSLLTWEPRDWDAGTQMLEVACYGRDARGCRALGTVLLDAGMAEEGLRFLRRGCHFGSGCGLMAQMLAGADGGYELYELFDVAERACAKEQVACGLFAEVLLRPGVRDVPRAIEFAQYACRNNEQTACSLLDALDAGH